MTAADSAATEPAAPGDEAAPICQGGPFVRRMRANCRGLRDPDCLDSREGVPPELRCELGRRMGVAAAVVALLWAGFVAIAAAHGSLTKVSFAIALTIIAASLGMLALVVSSRASASRMSAFGKGYLLLTSLAVAVTETMLVSPFDSFHGISWNALLVAVLPVLLPCTPRRTLIKAVLAASMTPLAVLVLLPLRGLPLPDLWQWSGLLLPVYLAAGMAYLAARFINRLGTDIKRARNMGMYELESRLGAGGMGEVWRAKHRFLARPAAVKLIRGQKDGAAVPATVLSRFEREARVTASLQSPHTVALYDFGITEDGVFYYVMELLEGMDLDQLVKTEGPQPPARVVHILRQALDSLAEAHAHGLVHRDIKPANIIIGRRGLHEDFVKVLDFGLVKPAPGAVVSEAPGVDLTADNQISGTPAYLAPEMVLGTPASATAGGIDARADLYALGCLAYFLLTGKTVFDGATPVAMAIAHVSTAPVPPSRRTSTPIPAALEALILRCLAKRPEDRPASALEIIRALDRMDFDDDTAGVGRYRLPAPVVVPAPPA